MNLPLPTNTFNPMPGAYLVGGSVRDSVCGREPMDYDIAVAENPESYAENLAAKLKGRVVAIGKPGFPLYRIVGAPIAVDVTPIKGASITDDLAHRDFTINAMAYDLSNGKIIDPTGGLADAQQGVVRMVSKRAFEIDPVRMVRAYRMAAHLGFVIAAATAGTIKSQARKIQTSAGERVWVELLLILSRTNSYDSIKQMTQDQLLFAIIPELKQLKGCSQSPPHHLDVFEHTLLAYQSLENVLCRPAQYFSYQTEPLFIPDIQRQALLKLALLLHDIGKPVQRTQDAEGKIHFYGHTATSAAMARPIFKRLRMSNKQAHWVEWIIDNHSRPHDLFKLDQCNRLTPKAIGKFLRKTGENAPCLILHAMADNLGKNPDISNGIKQRLDFFSQLLKSHYKTAAARETTPLLDGRDLMDAFGLSPSPLLGTLLKGVEERRLAGLLTDKKEALDWVERYLRERPDLLE